MPKGSSEPGVEIDILEHYGHFPTEYQSVVHIWPKPKNDDEAARRLVFRAPSDGLYDAFHTYGVDVAPDWITFYLDGTPQGRLATPAEHKHRLMILANLALGSGWPITETPNPSVLEVDYIRAYRRKESGAHAAEER
jgi:beta-glucanase (GH16 family)